MRYKYFLKTPDNDAYVDLESDHVVEATLAAIKIKADDIELDLGYQVYVWRMIEPSDKIRETRNFLYQVHSGEVERFYCENKVVSKWI